MKVVLAEKPSVARELAAFLGARERRDGYLEGSGYQVAWALGHLVELCEPEDYDPAFRRWSLDTLPIAPAQFRLRAISNPAGKRQYEIVRRLLKGAEEIIAATDAGREGELIFRYILELAGLERRPFRRLWLNSLSPEAIRRAFQNLRPGAEFDPLYRAARCRSQADWIVGLNATRNFTVRHGGRGVLWSAGRVQTPVLALISSRDDEIRAFRPETFFELWTRYRDTRFRHTGDRFSKREDAEALLASVVGHELTIVKIETRRRVEQPPQLYDLTDLQRDANRRFGLSADQVLKAAQRLYEAKAITYPRTDSRYLTADLKTQVRDVLDRLKPHKPAEIGKLNLASLPFTARIVDDRKVTDHHAILPTGAWPASLAGAEAKVFEAIVTRLIAAFYPPCIKLLTTVDGKTNEVPFRAQGVQVLDPGWTVLYPRAAKTGKAARSRRAETETVADDEVGEEPPGVSRAHLHGDRSAAEEQTLPEFVRGESGPHAPSIEQGETRAPPHYTENTLLAAMETAGRLVDDEELKEALKERGLGTPATRASIIETLLSRGYLAREKKSLLATDLGRYLIALVRDPRLKSAELTGDWEARLKRIEADELDPRQFMDDIVRYTREIVGADDLRPLDLSRWGDCPRCGAPVIEGKRDFGCSRWRDGCAFVLRREFEGVELSTDRVRELLQRRAIPWPAAAAAQSLLFLSDPGALFLLPGPEGSTNRPQGKKKASRKSARRTRSNDSSSTTPSPKKTRPRKSRSKTRDPIPESSAASAESLGPCPLCGQPVLEQKKSFSCSGWKEGCPTVIWKSIAKKRITRRIAEELLKTGAAGPLQGFKSKAGKAFEARLKLADGRVQFEFSERN